MSELATDTALRRAQVTLATTTVIVAAALWLSGLAISAIDLPISLTAGLGAIAAGAAWSSLVVAVGGVLLAWLLVAGSNDSMRERDGIVIGLAMAAVALPDLLFALLSSPEWTLDGQVRPRSIALWTVSRTALATAFLIGPLRAATAYRPRAIATPLLLITAGAWTLALAVAFGIPLPTLQTYGAVAPRPYDLPALLLFATAGLVVLPQAFRQRPSALGRAVMMSMVPQVLAQIEAAFGSAPGLDDHDLVALLLRLIGYAALVGALTLELLGRTRLVTAAAREFETTRRELTRQTEELVRVDRERIVQEAKRRRAERLLQMLEKAVERMSIGVVITEPDATILYVNPAGSTMHGYTPGELMGTRFDLLAPDGEAPPEPGADAPPGRPWVREQMSRTRDGGTFPCRLVSDRVRDDHGEVVAVVTCCEDISERRRVEQMKQDFIATVSHELRTPLTSIVAALGLLGQASLRSDPDRLDELTSVAHRNSHRLLNLVNDLLDLQRLSSGRLSLDAQTVDIAPLLEEAAAGMRAFAQEKDVRIAVRAERRLRVVADRRRMVQVLLNLLSNAIKFSPAGGEVDISGRTEGESVVLAVRDSGPGIPEAFRAQLFERFTQADASSARITGGSGLGLAIARQLVEAMGGSIGFDTVEGEGTTFHVALPLASEG